MLFVNYIICVVACKDSSMVKEIGVIALIGASMLLLCGSIVLLYKCINVNVMYNGIYVVLMLLMIYDKNIRLSDASVFSILMMVVLIAIFCWYLYVYESKIQRILSKGGEVGEVEDAYKKQVLNLLFVLLIAGILLMIVYHIVENVSARIITYTYSSNAIFSIPAIAGFVLVMLISVFVFVVYMAT